MALPPVQVKVQIDFTNLRAQLNQLTTAIKDSIDRGFREGARAATTSGGGLSRALNAVSDSAKKVATSTKAATASVTQLTDAERRLNQQLKQAVSTIGQVAQAQQRFNTVRARAFADALTATTAEQRFTQELLKQAAVVGTDIAALERLAQATGAFSTADIQAAASVAKLRAEVDLLTTAFQKDAAAEDKLIGKIKQLAAEEARLAQQTRQASEATRQQAQSVGALRTAFGATQVALAQFNNVMAAIRNVITIVDQTLGALFRTARQGAVILQTAESFQGFAESVVGIPDLLEQIETASRGTVSAFEAQQQALTLISGVTPELARTFSEALVGAAGFETSLIEVARAAQILNPALGDVDFFLKSLSIGIKRNERRWIDNLGIVISARESYDRFSEASGKSVDSLTAQDKQLAILNETLRVGKILVDQVGESTDSAVDPFKRLEVQVENLTNEFKVFLAEAVLPTVQFLAGDFDRQLDNTIQKSGELATAVVKSADEQKQALIDLGQATRDVDLQVPVEGFLSLEALAARIAFVIGQFKLSDAVEQQRTEVAQQLVLLASDADNAASLFADAFADIELPGGDIIGVLEPFIEGVSPDETRIAFEAFSDALNAGKTDAEALGVALFELERRNRELGFAIADEAGELRLLTGEVGNNDEQLREWRAAIDAIADEALPKQIKLAEQLAAATDPTEIIELTQQFAQSLDDQFTASLRVIGLSDTAIDEFRIGIGDLTVEQAEAAAQARLLNREIDKLAFIVAESEVSTEEATNAYLALKFGFADSAEEALNLARNQEFVTNTLLPTARAAEETADALEDLAAQNLATAEATQKLRDSLRQVVESGFDKATQAILDYGEAQRGIAAASGEFATVTINNSQRIAEITEQLFGDLDEDTRKALDEQLEAIRDAGGDVSQEYADILGEIAADLSQAERDALIIELFDLQAEQGTIVSGIFGADPQALEQFGEDAQQAIQDLIDIRRQTVVDLLKVGPRDLPFETEVALLLNFELIDDLEAELLIKNRQFFDLVDAIFGEASVIQLNIDGEIKSIDLGAITLEELGAEGVADLVGQIEQLVSAGLGDEAQVLVPLVLRLLVSGEVDVTDIPAVISGAVDNLLAGETLEQAVAIQLIPSFETVEELEATRRRLELLADAGEEIPVELAADIAKFDEIIGRLEDVDGAIEEIKEDEEVEVVIIAETEEAQTAIDQFIAANANLQIDIDIVPRAPSGAVIPPGAAPTPPPSPIPAGPGTGIPEFQEGGFVNVPRGNVEFGEFVFTQQSVDALGINSLQALQDGDAAIVPDFLFGSQTNVPMDGINMMLAALNPQVPTLAPAQNVSNTFDNRRITTTDRSVTNFNIFVDNPDEIIPVADFFG